MVVMSNKGRGNRGEQRRCATICKRYVGIEDKKGLKSGLRVYLAFDVM